MIVLLLGGEVSSSLKQKMRKIKIMWMGKHLRDVYPHATRLQVFKFRMFRLFKTIVQYSLVTVFGIIVVSIVALHYQLKNPVIVQAIDNNEVVIPAVLLRIAKCESNDSHYDKNGQVLINSTKDIGKYQINVPIWGKKASEMGLNLAVEADNQHFALWLYENSGTEAWVHSKKCWK